MEKTRGIVGTCKSALKQLKDRGPADENWELLHSSVNQMVNMWEENLKLKMRDGSPYLSEKDQANIKEAIEIRQQIDRKVKEMRRV